MKNEEFERDGHASVAGSCEAMLDRVFLAASGDLPPEENRALQAHVERCASCRAAVDEAAALRADLRAEREVADDPEMLDRMRAGVLAAIAEDSSPRRGRVLPFPARAVRLPLAAAALAASLLFAFFASTRPAPTPFPVSPPAEQAENAEDERESVPAGPRAIVPAEPLEIFPAEPLNARTFAPANVRPTDWPRAAAPAETVVHLVSDDSDVVIYWLIDTPSETEPLEQEI